MKKNQKIFRLLIPFFLVAGLMVWISCNKGFDRVVLQRDYQDTTSAVAKNPHVLYIVIDGARGQSVRDAQPPNIMSLTDHAIYCWNDVTDAAASRLTSWADLLTGVHQDKHEVLNADLSKSDLKDYPVFFNYIKEREPSFRITAFSASDSIKPLITGTDVNEVFHGNDAETEKAALSELNRDSSRLVFVEFAGVDSAGSAYGYDISVPQYKSAILKTDGYIGEMLDAIRKHKDYANEDWMVVITSDRGGPFNIPPSEDDHTVLSDPSRNSFVIYYAPQYQPSFIDKPYTGQRYEGESVELYGEDTAAVNAVVPDDNNDYNFGDSTDFTIEMKVKLQPGPGTYGTYNYYYPSILSKRELYRGGIPGWNISLNGLKWQINFGQAGMSDVSVSGVNVSDGTWHDIAVVVEIRNGHRYVRTYTDGNFNKESDITDLGNINTSAPLTMGYLAGNIYTPAEINITDLKIWTKALSDATMGQISCDIGLPADQSLSNYLIGYWPCTDGQGDMFVDHGTLQHNFQINGSYQWESFSDLICTPAASDLAVTMPKPVDAVRQILNWLQIAADPKWDLDGRVWTTNYVGIKQ